MRPVALVIVASAVGCGSVLNSPDGGTGGSGGGQAGAGGAGGIVCMVGNTGYPVGPLPSLDGCNSCACTIDGQIACTDRYCPPDAGACAFDTTYRYGQTGGLVAYEDVATLAPPTSYRYERTSRITDPASSACAPTLPACGVVDLYSPADIMRAIADPDVQTALAMATPPIYGGDPRPVDGTIFQFLRADGHGFLAGGVCSGAPLPGNCVDVPAGIARLVNALQALDQQQLQDPSCAALR
jgi:hypothetical protein